MDDLLNRLRVVDPPGGNEHSTRWYRNPDGPEAADEIERLQEELADAMEVLGYRDRDIEKFRKGTLAFTAEVERLQARVRELEAECRAFREAYPNLRSRMVTAEARVQELEAAHEPMAAAVVAAYEFIRRECAETNPETGEIVDAGALPTWHLVCEAYGYALPAVSAEKEGDDE